MSANQDKEVNPSSTLSMDESVDRTLLVLDTAFSHDDNHVDVDLSDQSILNQKQAIKSTSGYEEITVDLSISNFKGLYDVVKTNGIRILVEEKFTVGGQNWAFHLHQNKEEDVGVALFFYGTESTFAEYSIRLESSDGRLTYTGRFGLRQLTPGRAGWGKASWKSMSQLQNHLSDGSLRLKLILTVYSGDESKAFLRMEASKDFSRGLDPVVGVGTDLTFVIKEGSKMVRTIRAHKAILSLRSSVFASKFAWATNGEIEIISDMSPKAFGILLGFIYSGELDDEWESVAGELLYGANKYELKSLRTFLMAKMNAPDLASQIPVLPA